MYLKRHVHQSKYGTLEDEVELINVNPEYPHVILPDVKENTVPFRHLESRNSSTSASDEQPSTEQLAHLEDIPSAHTGEDLSYTSLEAELEGAPLQEIPITDDSLTTKQHLKCIRHARHPLSYLNMYLSYFI